MVDKMRNDSCKIMDIINNSITVDNLRQYNFSSYH